MNSAPVTVAWLLERVSSAVGFAKSLISTKERLCAWCGFGSTTMSLNNSKPKQNTLAHGLAEENIVVDKRQRTKGQTRTSTTSCLPLHKRRWSSSRSPLTNLRGHRNPSNGLCTTTISNVYYWRASFRPEQCAWLARSVCSVMACYDEIEHAYTVRTRENTSTLMSVVIHCLLPMKTSLKADREDLGGWGKRHR